MEALLGFLLLLGLLGILLGFILLIILAATRNSKKVALFILAGSFILFVISIVSWPTSPPPDLSPQSFDEGVELFNNKQYEAAIKKFERVSEEYEKYDEAQTYIQEASTLYSHGLLALAKKYFDASNYIAAIETATRAISYNAGIEDDANALINKANQEHQIAMAEQKRIEHLEKMKTYEGEGAARVAVVEVIGQNSFNDGLTTWTPQNKDTWYLLVAVGVANASNATLHVNPTYITLICDNRAYNPDIKTYSITGGYLDAINLQPRTYAAGWLLFLVPKADSYSLVYNGMFDKPVTKEIVVTQTK